MHSCHCLRQIRQQIRSDQSLLSEQVARTITGHSVQINRRRDCRVRTRWELSQQASYKTSQNVAGSSRRHSGISRCIHKYWPVRQSDQRTVSLEHHDASVLSREVTRNSDAIRLNLGHAQAS